ncbi:MAG TPA: hypothetical protein GX497_07395 [Bacillus bacterium]|nr:hypothetical protein [Bacillus sp. (in: firmicutes)]
MYVIFNQKGFILPLTMMLMFLFPLVIISELEIYKMEQRFYIEEEEIEKLQSLSQIGIQDLFALAIEQPITEATGGKLYYLTGRIDYTIEPLGLNLLRIRGTCYTDKERQQVFIANVNLETNEIEKWVVQ